LTYIAQAADATKFDFKLQANALTVANAVTSATKLG